MQIKGAYYNCCAFRHIPSCVFSAVSWSCSLVLIGGAFLYLLSAACPLFVLFGFVLIIEFFHVWNPNIFFKLGGLNAWGTQRILTNWKDSGKEQNMEKLRVRSPLPPANMSYELVKPVTFFFKDLSAEGKH